MKIKTDFVTNSSSSSFIIKKKDLTYEQAEKIINHVKLKNCDSTDSWHIIVEENHIKGFTSMDNFDMRSYLDDIGIDSSKIKWDD